MKSVSLILGFLICSAIALPAFSADSIETSMGLIRKVLVSNAANQGVFPGTVEACNVYVIDLGTSTEVLIRRGTDADGGDLASFNVGETAEQANVTIRQGENGWVIRQVTDWRRGDSRGGSVESQTIEYIQSSRTIAILNANRTVADCQLNR